MSWQNLVLYMAAIPSYDSKSKESKDDGVKKINWDKLDACNPKNFRGSCKVR